MTTVKTNQLDRYKVRRAANTLPDGSRPYGWWKRYQRRINQTKTMSDADIRRDAARHAKALAELTGDDNDDTR